MDSETLDRIEQRLRRIEMMLFELKDNGTKQIMSVDEVAEYTGYSKRYIYNLTQFKKIPHYKREGKLFFDKEEIEKWIKENRISTDSEVSMAASDYCITH